MTAMEPTVSPSLSPSAGDVNGRAAMGVLCYIGFTVLLLQVGIVPQLMSIGRQLHLSPGGVTWVLTLELLAGAISLAVFNRLSDLYGKRRIIVVCLSFTLLGALLGALTSDPAALFAARALMGAQAALLALPTAIAGDTMSPRRARTTVAVIHTGNSVGVAAGLLFGGLVGAAGYDYHLYFWVAAGTVALGLVATLGWVRESAHRASGRFDVPGALCFGTGLPAVLLGVSKGAVWGWTSALVLGLILAGVVLIAVGWLVQCRVREPLIDPSLLRRRSTVLPNLVVFLIAFGIYGAISAVSRFVQTPPKVAGYGFGYSPLQTCLLAVPVAVGGVVAARALQPIGRRLGFGGAASVSVLCCSVAYFALAAVHGSSVPMMISLGLYALGNTMGIAAAQILVLQCVPPQRSGVALGLTAILYAVGNSLGSTVVGVLFTADAEPVTHLPANSAYTLSFVVCGACTTVAALLAWYVRRPRGSAAADPVA